MIHKVEHQYQLPKLGFQDKWSSLWCLKFFLGSVSSNTPAGARGPPECTLRCVNKHFIPNTVSLVPGLGFLLRITSTRLRFPVVFYYLQKNIPNWHTSHLSNPITTPKKVSFNSKIYFCREVHTSLTFWNPAVLFSDPGKNITSTHRLSYRYSSYLLFSPSFSKQLQILWAECIVKCFLLMYPLKFLFSSLYPQTQGIQEWILNCKII